MRPSEALARHRDALLAIAARHGVSNVRVFGSVARGEDHEGSDVDLLVDPQETTTYFDLSHIKREGEALLGISLDIHTPNGLKDYVRMRVLRDARPL